MELKYEPVMDAKVRPHGGRLQFSEFKPDQVEGWCLSRCIVVPVVDPIPRDAISMDMLRYIIFMENQDEHKST